MHDLATATHSPAGQPLPPPTAAVAAPLERLSKKGWKPANDAFVRDGGKPRGRSRRSSIGIASPTRAMQSHLLSAESRRQRQDDVERLFGMSSGGVAAGAGEAKPRRIGGWLSTSQEESGARDDKQVDSPRAGSSGASAQSRRPRRSSGTSQQRRPLAASGPGTSHRDGTAAADPAAEGAGVGDVPAAVVSGTEAAAALGINPFVEGQDGQPARKG